MQWHWQLATSKVGYRTEWYFSRATTRMASYGIQITNLVKDKIYSRISLVHLRSGGAHSKNKYELKGKYRKFRQKNQIATSKQGPEVLNLELGLPNKVNR